MNANGEKISVTKFEGRFVWADYAAPWCQPCTNQAQAIKSLEKTMGDKVVFLTVITSASPEYQSIPTRETARSWAHSFGLDPNRVVAATNLWGWKIPTHILYSPLGQSLYRSTGYLPEGKIREILTRYMEDWENWSENGKKVSWMR